MLIFWILYKTGGDGKNKFDIAPKASHSITLVPGSNLTPEKGNIYHMKLQSGEKGNPINLKHINFKLIASYWQDDKIS